MTCFLRKGRFSGFVLLGAGDGWQSQQNSCYVLVLRTKVVCTTADDFGFL